MTRPILLLALLLAGCGVPDRDPPARLSHVWQVKEQLADLESAIEEKLGTLKKPPYRVLICFKDNDNLEKCNQYMNVRTLRVEEAK